MNEDAREREQRLKAALRENLKKRKAQARGRAAGKPEVRDRKTARTED